MKNHWREKPTFLLLFTCLALLFILQLHNLRLYPPTRGLDAKAHIDYINFLKTERRIPLPNEGWEMYQPPLYYSIASLLPNLKWAQVVGLGGYLILVIISYIFFRKMFKDKLLTLGGTVIIGLLPTVIYLTPQISNEFFSGVLISVTLIYYLVFYTDRPRIKKQILLGVLMGLSLLSKSTAFVLLIAILIDQLLKLKFRWRSVCRNLGLVLLITVLISGWFYARNIILFHNPFVVAEDFPQYKIAQPPGERNLDFFTDVSSLWRLDLFHAHWYSFWGGMIFSWFYDGNNSLLPVQGFSRAGNLLIILSLPLIFFSLKGLVEMLKNGERKNQILLYFSMLLFISFVAYVIKRPYYSTVKAFYMISLVVPWAYFVIRGVRTTGRLAIFFPYYLFFYFILVLKNFWILPFWYR